MTTTTETKVDNRGKVTKTVVPFDSTLERNGVTVKLTAIPYLRGGTKEDSSGKEVFVAGYQGIVPALANEASCFTTLAKLVARDKDKEKGDEWIELLFRQYTIECVNHEYFRPAWIEASKGFTPDAVLTEQDKKLITARFNTELQNTIESVRGEREQNSGQIQKKLLKVQETVKLEFAPKLQALFKLHNVKTVDALSKVSALGDAEKSLLESFAKIKLESDDLKIKLEEAKKREQEREAKLNSDEKELADLLA